MDAPRQPPDTNFAVQRALNKLKQAEVDLIAAIAPGAHPKNALLLEAHSMLWELISTLEKAESRQDQ
ncbi:MAG: hypothetical protein WB780_23815 [Candidatus Acidiferrales bacterium]